MFESPPIENPKNYSGREYEYDLFDAINVDNPRYRILRDELLKKQSPEDQKKGKLSFEDSFWLIKQFQPQESETLRKPFIRDLRIAIGELLNWPDDEQIKNIQAYTAVGSNGLTSLDRFYGTDAVIAIQLDGREYLLKYDATLNRKKMADAIYDKWRIIIGNAETDDSEKHYQNIVDDFAKQSVELLNEFRRRDIYHYPYEPKLDKPI